MTLRDRPTVQVIIALVADGAWAAMLVGGAVIGAGVGALVLDVAMNLLLPVAGQ